MAAIDVHGLDADGQVGQDRLGPGDAEDLLYSLRLQAVVDDLELFVRIKRVRQGVGTVGNDAAVIGRGGNEGTGKPEQKRDTAQSAALSQEPAQVVTVAEQIIVRFDRKKGLTEAADESGTAPPNLPETVLVGEEIKTGDEHSMTDLCFALEERVHAVDTTGEE